MTQTIFLTGATGTMGWAGMQEILHHPDKYQLRILARPSAKNKAKLAPYLHNPNLQIIWGDLTSYDDVLKGVTGADIVLHVGGMVSPQADYKPSATRRTNLTAAVNIRDAVLAQKKQPKLVYIGSVAQMGDHREPLHWGRAGDPICVSAYDHYGITKALAERILTNSGIKRWVSLRQSGILYPAILKNYDPIMFHVPIRGVLEWATIEDSGRLLERVCREEVPEDFWNRYYNIGSGENYRLSNYEFECLLLNAIGVPKPERIFNANWFTTRNFHGMWYVDGDELENYLHFRANIPVKEYFKQMAASDNLPASLKFAVRSKLTYASYAVPHIVKLAMWAVAVAKEHGTQWWIKQFRTTTDSAMKEKVSRRIHAYYGSLQAYEAIPDWKHMDLTHNSDKVVLLDHGYDETKNHSEFTIQDMQQAAAFRGGKCLSKTMKKGDWDTQLEWEDAEGNTFMASPRLILLGGHWSPYAFPYPYTEKEANDDLTRRAGIPLGTRPWAWDKEAKQNPFFAQIWAPLHHPDENNTYGPEIFHGWEQ